MTYKDLKHVKELIDRYFDYVEFAHDLNNVEDIVAITKSKEISISKEDKDSYSDSCYYDPRLFQNIINQMSKYCLEKRNGIEQQLEHYGIFIDIDERQEKE